MAREISERRAEPTDFARPTARRCARALDANG
jgi:hypothetical protein